jgi:hypothetical protein
MGRCACAARNARRRRRSARDTPGRPTAVKVVLFRRLLRAAAMSIRCDGRARPRTALSEPSAKGFAVRPGGHELGTLTIYRFLDAAAG